MQEINIGPAKLLVDPYSHIIADISPLNSTFGTRLTPSRSYSLDDIANAKSYPLLAALAKKAIDSLDNSLEISDEFANPTPIIDEFHPPINHTPGYVRAIAHSATERYARNNLILFILITILIIIVIAVIAYFLGPQYQKFPIPYQPRPYYYYY